MAIKIKIPKLSSHRPVFVVSNLQVSSVTVPYFLLRFAISVNLGYAYFDKLTELRMPVDESNTS